jgi:NADH:ubiquinone oxidoreductase subunit 6 (subunit J)
MTMTELIFHGFLLLTAGAGVALALSKNVVHAAFLLFVVLLGVAALYVFAGAEFLAVSQVIIYVGGALVVVIFGVMLTAKIREMKPQTELVNVIPGALLAVSLFMTMLYVLRESHVAQSIPAATAPTATPNVEQVGVASLTTYLLPFELVSVLLLTVLVGAAYLSRKPKPNKEEAP